jgi:hypothetical protein
VIQSRGYSGSSDDRHSCACEARTLQNDNTATINCFDDGCVYRSESITNLINVHLLTNRIKMAVANRRKIEIHRPISNSPIKRKVGYEMSDEEVSDTQRKLVNMSMNNRHSE